ncbi:DUF4189 domain-containing protein [Stenotrophomonas indicatrix]|nr:DUF4189 domain-containing protein [Stenotrophomonas indicatrix]
MTGSAVLSTLAGDAQAEGRCPPGQYPIGDGQGVGGCAPIPGSGGGEAQSAPVPTGRWIKTWGAIATAVSTGDMGASVGRRSRQEAVSEALSRCSNYGAKDCKVGTTYKNQCVAYADPERGSRGRVSYSVASSKEEATSRVLSHCADIGGGQCKVLYTDCSEPIFESF